ncbi:MAG: succinylglutamate desuccinylase/aspartoacylase family protein [Chloroflexi bacterium]|nr:succinylglutamate desuccinylase/aspartoacylase family protein [Chloroflexota bacterium]
MSSTVTFGPASAKPGTKEFAWLEVCTMADGAPLRIPVHIIAGSRPGPRLTVLSAQHGYEISEIEVCRQIIQKTDPRKLKGTLVVVPVASPISFEGGVRSTWIDSLYGDNGNMNRVWPGRADGWITDRAVYLMGQELIKGSDVVVDLHDCDTSSPGLTIYYGYCMSAPWNEEVSERTRQISKVSGFDILIKRQVPTLAGSLGQFALSEGIPFFACEVGEFYGFQLKEGDLQSTRPVRTVPESGVTALENIMTHLGMIEGRPKLPKRQLLISPENNLRPSHGGLLFSNYDRTAIGKVVPKGTLLGTVVSPYSFEALEEIRAPYDQNMIIAVTHHRPFSRVNTGNYGFIVSDMATAEWVEN